MKRAGLYYICILGLFSCANVLRVSDMLKLKKGDSAYWRAESYIAGFERPEGRMNHIQ